MQVVRDYRDGTQSPGEEPWFDRVLVIWTEDDATRYTPGHEGPNQAFQRLAGKEILVGPQTRKEDLGDSTIYLLAYGWTVCYTPGGAEIGVVYRVVGEQGC